MLQSLNRPKILKILQELIVKAQCRSFQFGLVSRSQPEASQPQQQNKQQSVKFGLGHDPYAEVSIKTDQNAQLNTAEVENKFWKEFDKKFEDYKKVTKAQDKATALQELTKQFENLYEEYEDKVKDRIKFRKQVEGVIEKHLDSTFMARVDEYENRLKLRDEQMNKVSSYLLDETIHRERQILEQVKIQEEEKKKQEERAKQIKEGIKLGVDEFINPVKEKVDNYPVLFPLSGLILLVVALNYGVSGSSTRQSKLEELYQKKQSVEEYNKRLMRNSEELHGYYHDLRDDIKRALRDGTDCEKTKTTINELLDVPAPNLKLQGQ